MLEAYLGEIRCFGFAQPPEGWALCDGKIMNIKDNQALYAVLGATFGGDGRTTFALPNLCGRVGVGIGTRVGDINTSYAVGNTGGAESVALTTLQVPPHGHTITANEQVALNSSGVGAYLAKPDMSGIGQNLYATDNPSTARIPLDPGSVSAVGGKAHDNMQPFQVIMFAIATHGFWPNRPEAV